MVLCGGIVMSGILDVIAEQFQLMAIKAAIIIIYNGKKSIGNRCKFLEEMEMQTYFIYVRRYSILTNSDELYVYKVVTDSVYRIIGKIVVTSLEEIKRIDFCRWLPEKEAFWKERGIEIIEYKEPRLSEDL